MSDSKKTEKYAANSDIKVSTATLARYFAVTTKTIQNLTNDGVIVKVGRGTYNLPKSVQAYVTYLKSRTGASDDSKTLANEKMVEEVRIKRIKAEKEELKLKEMKGELHKASDVEQLVTGMIMAVKSKLDAIAPKLAPQLRNIDEADYIFDKIDEEIKRAENELSEIDFSSKESKEVVEDGS